MDFEYSGLRIPPPDAMSFPRVNYLASSGPKKRCRVQQGFVVSDKALSFLASVCRFRQSFVDSDKRLLFPTNDLSESRKFRNWMKHVTACRTHVPASRCEMTKNSVYTHRQGQLPGTISGRTHKEQSFFPDLPISEALSE